jgi:hypothetical protein
MFRFTIRDVLWLMVVVGILCAWWIEDGRKYAAYRELYGGNGSFRSQFNALKKRARSEAALKAEAEELTAIAFRQIREDVAKRMEVSHKFRKLKAKVDALPPPEASLFDEWPPVPPWESQ